jgi:hypothetical protein
MRIVSTLADGIQKFREHGSYVINALRMFAACVQLGQRQSLRYLRRVNTKRAASFAARLTDYVTTYLASPRPISALVIAVFAIQYIQAELGLPDRL